MTSRLEVREQVLTCTGCELQARQSGPVPFSGPAPAHVAILGEAPGRLEDERGEPFIGPAGQLLRRLLTEAGIAVDQCFFFNAVSCWPNRDPATPTKAELKACAPNMEAQLELAQPKWVLAVGNVALSVWCPTLRISRVRRHLAHPNGYGNHPIVFFTFHPSAALRTTATEKALREDLALFAQMVAAPDRTGDDGATLYGYVHYEEDSCVVCGCTVEDMEDHDLVLRFDDLGLSYCSSCYDTASPQAKAEVKELKKLVRVQERTGQLFG